MSEFLNHPEFFNQPVCLTRDEIEYPIKVINHFFIDYKLSELRSINDDIEEVCLTTDAPPFDDGDERSKFLLYQYNLIRLLEAVFVLAEIKSQGSKDPKISPR